MIRSMQSIVAIALVGMATVVPAPLAAQSAAPAPVPPTCVGDYLSGADAVEGAGGVGLETSVLWPFFPGLFFQVRAAVPVWSCGELLLGAQGRVPEQRPAEGTFANYDFSAGYRQFVWQGFHVELTLNAGYGMVRDSTVDGLDYDSFDLEAMAVVGWRFQFGRFYTVVQPLGLGVVFHKTNPWPVMGQGRPTAEAPIYVGNLVVGIRIGD